MNIINFLISITLMILGMSLSSTKPSTSSSVENSNTVAQRDAKRRDDFTRIASAITMFQTNNNGKTPMQQNPMYDEDQFIKAYLVGSGDSWDVVTDPSGIQYVLKFSNFDDNASYGLIREMDYTVYIVGKAACDGDQVIESEKARDYAISYRLEGGETYCEDNR